MRRVYNGLTLHDTDIEHLCHRVLETWQRTRTRLSHHDQEDLLAYLVATAWELSTRYQPGRSGRYDQYVYPILLLRCTDWLRKDEGRTTWRFTNGHANHERPPRERPLSLDEPAIATAVDSEPLGATLADSRSHDAPTRDPDGTLGLLAETSRRASRDLAILRAAADRRARQRTPRARAA